MSKRTTRAKWLKAGPTAAQRKRVPLGSHAAGHNVELKIVRDIQEGDRAVRLAFPGLLHPSLAAAGLLPDPPADQLASWLPPAAARPPTPTPNPIRSGSS